ncbi:Metallo-hydrolase/oxidoreductase [Mytilinidion resinicola]|uniref:Metallo-hydrolase/oxidoreductase n=1 Tax=Mytilinidion resinicola TaxID=574789 RepID=A0A6A6YLG3_9PEZI|nr:Metallo-hydrolase/oxidoreductase [Mytilinidion resinicola]KAF2809403.1 Metallo-hydrolase/oxidoreductase [Mytilinidion resinicola]
MNSSSAPALPACPRGQKFVTISPLTSGFITLPERSFVSPADSGAVRTVPSMAFLITHPGLADGSSKPFYLMFDLGLRSDLNRYTPMQQAHLRNRQPYQLGPSVARQLADGGIAATEIDAIVISHMHYDHHGDLEDFPTSEVIVGHGAWDITAHGLPSKGTHQHFDPHVLPKERTVELPPVGSTSVAPEQRWKWDALGPLPAAIDLLGDGSVYVLDCPGHLPGHVNLLCRTGPTKWVCLCGDAFHDPRLLSGERDLGFWADEDGHSLCIHLDPEGARESIARLRMLQQLGGIHVVAAHDEHWHKANQTYFFPNTLP